jgi:hypothetical protein
MYKVYGDYISGNCYKVKLILNLLGLPYQWIPVNILKGETQSPEFLEKNPNGKIPVLELDDGTTLWESNAILNFCSGSSSSSTATSLMSRWRASSSCTRGCLRSAWRNTRSAMRVGTRRLR